jgi:hypothetical protein
MIIVNIPRDPRGDSPLPVEKVTSHHAEVEIGRTAEEINSLEALYPQQMIPQRRVKLRKNKENGEAQAPSELHAKSDTKELLMHAIQLEPVEGPSRKTYGRRIRRNTEGMDVRESSQQLKQAQLTTVELYQENRGLRQQVEEKTLEASAS